MCSRYSFTNSNKFNEFGVRKHWHLCISKTWIIRIQILLQTFKTAINQICIILSQETNPFKRQPKSSEIIVKLVCVLLCISFFRLKRKHFINWSWKQLVACCIYMCLVNGFGELAGCECVFRLSTRVSSMWMMKNVQTSISARVSKLKIAAACMNNAKECFVRAMFG